MALEGCTNLFELILSRSDAGSLGAGEDGGGHHLEADIVLLAEDAVHHVDALHLRSMSQHLLAVYVTDGVDSRIRRFKN